MSDVNTLLSQRLKKGEQSSKMAAMAKESATGNRTSFSGIFGVAELSLSERGFLEAILHEYQTGKEDLDSDLNSLISITSEVKAINNQAAILHGERIKKAHTILIRYKDGAFTSWLNAAYGNRQTPYNFLQYYLFWEAMPKPLRPTIELMPRQAIYTLASREGSLDVKKGIIENYKGETKSQLLTLIRDKFPLSSKDQRGQNIGETAIKALTRLYTLLDTKKQNLSKGQKQAAIELLKEIHRLIDRT
jgi:Uncharacterised protein family (UPF0137)